MGVIWTNNPIMVVCCYDNKLIWKMWWPTHNSLGYGCYYVIWQIKDQLEDYGNAVVWGY